MWFALAYFKRGTHTFGHDAGDRLLREFADMLRVECRQSDIIGRLGGEEFALLAPETPLASAQCLAERIREACQDLVVMAAAGKVQCSCSVGVTELTPHDDDIDEVLR